MQGDARLSLPISAQALQLYLVHSNDRPPKQAPHIGKVGWMDLDSLLTNARLLSFEGGQQLLITRVPAVSEDAECRSEKAEIRKHPLAGHCKTLDSQHGPQVYQKISRNKASSRWKHCDRLYAHNLKPRSINIRGSIRTQALGGLAM